MVDMSLHDDFPGGIGSYTKMQLKTELYFPENKVCCQYCRLFCRYEDAYNRYSCRLTDEWLLDIKGGVGHLCPLMEVE